MSIFRKLDPHFFERNRNEVIISLVNSVGFVVFFLFGINAIVAQRKENKDGPHENSQFSFLFCAGTVAIQTAFLFIKPTMWNLENIVSKVALASVSFETFVFLILSKVIDFDEEFQTYLILLQAIPPVFLFVGSVQLFSLEEDDKKGLNQADKCHIDNEKTDDIKTLERVKRILEWLVRENQKLVDKSNETQECMEDEIKALTEQSKLTETEKKKPEIDLEVKREIEDVQKDNDVSKKELEALTTAHSLQAENLRKMEEETLRMKAEIRALKELCEYDCSRWEKNVETIAMLTYKNEKSDVEAYKMEKICVDLRKNLDDLRKNSFVLQGDGEKAFRDAEQALIRSLLILQQQR